MGLKDKNGLLTMISNTSGKGSYDGFFVSSEILLRIKWFISIRLRFFDKLPLFLFFFPSFLAFAMILRFTINIVFTIFI